jgi:hypothetical protein
MASRLKNNRCVSPQNELFVSQNMPVRIQYMPQGNIHANRFPNF